MWGITWTSIGGTIIAGVWGFDEWFFRIPSNRGRLSSIPFKTL